MLRATARAHIPCDGRSLGRILATAGPDKAPEDGGARLRGRGPPARAKRLSRGPRGQADRLATAGADGPAHGSSRRRWTHGGRRARPRRAGERIRRPHGGWPVRDPACSGDRMPPAPWSNVDRECPRRIPVTERGGGFTWAVNSSVLPAHPLAQRSGERPGERGGLPAGRRDRRPVVRHAGAGPQRDRVHRAARPGLDLVRAPARAASPRTSRSAWPTRRRSSSSLLRLTQRRDARRGGST